VTLTELERLEAVHSKPQQMLNEGDMKAYYYAAKELESALPKAFPEMAKALREAWAHNEKLIETLKETDVRAAEWLGILEKMERERDKARAEVERLKGKLLEEARWVYDTGQRAKDALAEVERLREVAGQVHALANEAVRGTAVWEPLVEIHEITKGRVE